MKKQINQIKKVVSDNRLVEDRVVHLQNLGYIVSVLPMGSGGVGQVKEMRDKSTRVQISSGWGRYNYAYVVVL